MSLTAPPPTQYHKTIISVFPYDCDILEIRDSNCSELSLASESSPFVNRMTNQRWTLKYKNWRRNYRKFEI